MAARWTSRLAREFRRGCCFSTGNFGDHQAWAAAFGSPRPCSGRGIESTSAGRCAAVLLLRGGKSTGGGRGPGEVVEGLSGGQTPWQDEVKTGTSGLRTFAMWHSLVSSRSRRSTKALTRSRAREGDPRHGRQGVRGQVHRQPQRAARDQPSPQPNAGHAQSSSEAVQARLSLAPPRESRDGPPRDQVGWARPCDRSAVANVALDSEKRARHTARRSWCTSFWSSSRRRTCRLAPHSGAQAALWDLHVAIRMRWGG